VALRVVAVEGVPEITPPEESVSGLIDPLMILQVIGAVPVAEIWKPLPLYGELTVPLGRDIVVMVGAVVEAALMVSVKARSLSP
jgi:hypothetical protein